MLRVITAAAVVSLCVFAGGAAASAPPVGPLPKGPVSTIHVTKGSLVSIALSSRAGKSWRLARIVDSRKLVEVGEANVGKSVVVVYRAVGRGTVSVKYGLTRGETRKAYASATFTVTIA
jgi:hypothetical protein